MPDHLHASGGPDDVVVLALAAAAAVAYLVAARRLSGRRWPVSRTACWMVGVLAAVAAAAGPIGQAAQTSFVAHTVAHLLLGMLAPLLLVCGAPLTLLLRVLSAPAGRRLCRLLASRPLVWLTEPAVAAVLSVGGLWLLYGTGLYAATRDHPVGHVAVHVHLLASGYLFSTALVAVDPLPSRRRHAHRAAVLVLALAAHDILAKRLYLQPPTGVDPAEGERAAALMYYGGDAIDVLIMIALCAGWFRAARRAGVRAPDRTLLRTR